jgi:hypothetical protein
MHEYFLLELAANPKSAGVPDLVAFTDASGNTVVVDSGPSIALIVGIVIGALVVITLLIVIIVLCVRRRNKNASDAYYPLSDFGSKPAATTPATTSKVVRLYAIQAVSCVCLFFLFACFLCFLFAQAAHVGEGTISITVGQSLTADPADWSNADEWLWVIPNGNFFFSVTYCGFFLNRKLSNFSRKSCFL